MNILKHSLLYKTLCMKVSLERVTGASFLRFIALDVAFGIFILYNFVDIEKFHNIFWNYTDLLAEYLYTIITWLVSNPAGLKLNVPVNSTLSNFFKYHVHLWITFVNFLRFERFTRFVVVSLAGGVSHLASILADFSKVFFLHFLCFDTYATRLFTVIYHTICELWGLVRGKKWNPLRNRKDNVCLDSREQLLSTSLFVILIFILPTILVYFVVFRAIRYCAAGIIRILEFIAMWPMNVSKFENWLVDRLFKSSNAKTEEKPERK